jgi:peptidoglycan/xylan/chitin deacetylase (PgdA/CDA1 family)
LGLIGKFNRTAARMTPVKRGAWGAAAPTLSVTFDDFPRSAWTNGRAVLERHGALATYYVAGGYCGARERGIDYFDEADLAAVAAAGHEIGGHSFSHVHLPHRRSAEVEADCERNQKFLGRFTGGAAISSFAYPYGDVCVRTKRLAAERFVTARGIRPGVNYDPVELALLLAVPLERRSWSASAWRKLVAQAADRRGWLILFTHDVCAEPSRHGCTPRMLDEAVRTARDHGLQIATVGAAASRWLAPAPARAA